MLSIDDHAEAGGHPCQSKDKRTQEKGEDTCGVADVWFIETCLLLMEDTLRRPACEVLGPKVRKEFLNCILPVFSSHHHPPLHRQECSDEVCHKCAWPQIGEQPYLGPFATILKYMQGSFFSRVPPKK